MNPTELAEFVDQLDEDGGGKIEIEEVVILYVFIFVLRCDERMMLRCGHCSFFSLILVSSRFQHLLFAVFAAHKVEYVTLKAFCWADDPILGQIYHRDLHLKIANFRCRGRQRRHQRNVFMDLSRTYVLACPIISIEFRVHQIYTRDCARLFLSLDCNIMSRFP
jgi:hypothetical protein